MTVRAGVGLVALLLLGSCGEPAPPGDELPPERALAYQQSRLASAAADMQADPQGWDGGPGGDELSMERALQRELPTADGPTWRVLRQTRIWVDEESQLYHADHPAPVQRLAGQRIRLQGYMLPLDPSARTAHFLISPYTPVCFFHPPAEPNEVIEVRLRRPIRTGYHLVEVTGTLALANDGEKGLFFTMADATARIVERIE